MGYEPSGPFATVILELKLEVPSYQNLLEFFNMRAQASKTSIIYQQDKGKPTTRNDQTQARKGPFINNPVTLYTVSAVEQSPNSNCVVRKVERRPLSHSGKLFVTKSK